MLLELLTLILPIRVSERELEFHRDLVLTAYKRYHRTFVATGYRDRELLRKIEKRTAYSMRMLRSRDFKFWHRIARYRTKAWALKAATRLEKVHEVLQAP